MCSGITAGKLLWTSEKSNDQVRFKFIINEMQGMSSSIFRKETDIDRCYFYI